MGPKREREIGKEAERKREILLLKNIIQVGCSVKLVQVSNVFLPGKNRVNT